MLDAVLGQLVDQLAPHALGSADKVGVYEVLEDIGWQFNLIDAVTRRGF